MAKVNIREMMKEVIEELGKTDRTDLVEFVTSELEKHETNLKKRKAADAKKKSENAALIELIFESMEDGKGVTIAELIETIPELEGLRVQKVSPMLNNLWIAGRIEKLKKKKEGRLRYVKGHTEEEVLERPEK